MFNCLPNSASADGNLAEAAGQMGKKVENPNKVSPNQVHDQINHSEHRQQLVIDDQISPFSLHTVDPIAFLQMFAFVIFFGLFHALVFLPLAMSLIGPMPDARPEEVSKREPDMNNGVSVTKL